MNYEILKNRMNNGTPFLRQMAVARIDHLASSLEITQEQADELMAIAQSLGVDALPQDFASRLGNVEEAVNTIIGGEQDARA